MGCGASKKKGDGKKESQDSNPDTNATPAGSKTSHVDGTQAASTGDTTADGNAPTKTEQPTPGNDTTDSPNMDRRNSSSSSSGSSSSRGGGGGGSDAAHDDTLDHGRYLGVVPSTEPIPSGDELSRTTSSNATLTKTDLITRADLLDLTRASDYDHFEGTEGSFAVSEVRQAASESHMSVSSSTTSHQRQQHGGEEERREGEREGDGEKDVSSTSNTAATVAAELLDHDVDLGDTSDSSGPRIPMSVLAGKDSAAMLRFHLDAKDEPVSDSDASDDEISLPDGDDENQWICSNTFDFFNTVNNMYTTISQFCTTDSCPTMTAGKAFEYRWCDGDVYMDPTSMPAAEYVAVMTSWVQEQLNDTTVFPVIKGMDFSPSFRAEASNIYRRMFRVYAHIYCHHFGHVVHQKAELDLRKAFRHFVLFTSKFRLVTDKEFIPLWPLVTALRGESSPTDSLGKPPLSVKSKS